MNPGFTEPKKTPTTKGTVGVSKTFLPCATLTGSVSPHDDILFSTVPQCCQRHIPGSNLFNLFTANRIIHNIANPPTHINPVCALVSGFSTYSVTG